MLSVKKKPIVTALCLVLIVFQDVSNYNGNAVSEVMAASHACQSIERKIDQLDHFKLLQTRHFLSHFQKQNTHI